MNKILYDKGSLGFRTGNFAIKQNIINLLAESGITVDDAWDTFRDIYDALRKSTPVHAVQEVKNFLPVIGKRSVDV